MQVSVEATGNIGRRMTVAVPSERFEKEFSERLKRLSRTVRFPGFRPGKAPLKMIEAQYGEKVMQEVVSELIRSSFYEAVTDQGLSPAGGPRIEPKALGRGQDLEYTAEFEIYPSIARLDITGATIERPVCSVQPEDVERTLEIMRKQRTVWRPVERPGQVGDRLSIDFEGRLDGVAFEGGQARNFSLVLGGDVLIDGFERGLIGARAGEERTLNLDFPADYRNQQLAGKTAEFQVKVNRVEEPELPEVDGDFARQFGIGDGNADSLRAEVRANLEQEMEERVRAAVRDQVFKAIMELNRFEIPKALQDAEVERLVQQRRAALQSQGIPLEKAPVDPILFLDEARQRVALGLILAEIVKQRGLKVAPERVRARIEKLAASYESPQEFIQWHYTQPERLAQVESTVLEEQAVELLLQGAQVVDKPTGFQELMQGNKPLT
ncbi:MAG: trigger factor [Gammaproteobacteria bacterium]|nr:trigger factor [Gammaproteobacteria bacterium]